MIWILVWLVFALFIAWLFARSMRTVWRQQKAWTMFASKYGLNLVKNKWYRAPRIDGDIKGRRLSVYIEEITDPVLRVKEFRTTVEVYLKTGLPTGIAIGSRAYTSVIGEIDNVEKVSLDDQPAFKGLRAVARDKTLFEDWKARYSENLKQFFETPKSERLLMGHETDGFIIIQTADNLDDVKALNAMVKNLFSIASAIEEGGDEQADTDNSENDASESEASENDTSENDASETPDTNEDDDNKKQQDENDVKDTQST